MRFYLKSTFTLLIVLFALWGLTNSFAALSSASDLGVVIGVMGAFTSLALPIWLLIKLYKRKTNEKTDVNSNIGSARPHR